jgi:hypothetical protein
MNIEQIIGVSQAEMTKTQKAIITLANAVRDIIETQVSDDDVLGIQQHLQSLVTIQANSSRMVGMAKYLALERQKHVARAEIKENPRMSPNTLKMLVQGECAAELSLLEFVKGLDTDISHSIDAYRSILSMMKTEMQISQWQGT